MEKAVDQNKLSEYLKFLLLELDHYKDDCEITRDEYEKFISEFNRFKSLVKSSGLLSDEIKNDIQKLSFNPLSKGKSIKQFLRYIFLPDFAAYRLNQMKEIDVIEAIEDDITRILNKLEISKIRNNAL